MKQAKKEFNKMLVGIVFSVLLFSVFSGFGQNTGNIVNVISGMASGDKKV